MCVFVCVYVCVCVNIGLSYASELNVCGLVQREQRLHVVLFTLDFVGSFQDAGFHHRLRPAGKQSARSDQRQREVDVFKQAGYTRHKHVTYVIQSEWGSSNA